MKLNWLDCDSKKGNAWSGVNFRDRRMLTFSVIQKYPIRLEKGQKPEWIAKVWDDPIGVFPNKGQAQQACQRFLDDFTRGLFACDDE